MIELTPHAQGTVIAVAAQPGAKRAGVLGERNGALRLAVAAPPDQGKANAALADLLAETIGCRASAVRLLSGPTRRQKRFLVEGLGPDEVRERLRRALPE
ncbi:DUF167 domain-containing protein [Tautonia sociabilis]|uniref:UPF0235 protein TsocGM_10270 n=1 Tax=Tautonia sociabilis TaxID=2080755 RepID=A0A432MKG7_9BACT|nr:DUF167 family protein [Tautonia sociabilis]RUL87901.1 DUF167 domain-containing protein [Tautonia sociabilis]